MSWADTPIHFVDFEGNGVSGILEFGVATLHRGEIAATRTRLCRPAGRVTAADTAVHGLSGLELAAEAPFNDEWEYFSGLRQSGPLAAHFASAEHSLLRAVWPYPRTSPDFARPGRAAAEWGPWIDTGRLYPQLYPQVAEAKLGQLVQLAGQQALLDELAERHCPAGRRQFHAALYDALAAALLLRTLLWRPELSGATIPWLLQMSTLDPARRRNLQQGDLLA